MSNLTQHIHTLTRSHLSLGPDNKHHARPALLTQLEDAATEKRAGATGGGGTALPISTDAIALMQDIDWDARNEQYQRLATDKGTLTDIIQSWATEEAPDMVAYLEHVTLDWIDKINALISPVKPPWRPAVPCPACGIIYDKQGSGPGMRVHCWDANEAIMAPGDWSADCIHCGAKWAPSEMNWLSRTLEVAI